MGKCSSCREEDDACSCSGWKRKVAAAVIAAGTLGAASTAAYKYYQKPGGKGGYPDSTVVSSDREGIESTKSAWK